MKKIAKTFSIVLLSLVMCLTSIPVFASEHLADEWGGVSPRLSHFAGSAMTFSATEDGGYILVSYEGYDSFVRADLAVKIEKRFLWAFWNEVDEWSSSSTELRGDFYHVFELNGSGTYRATFTLKVTGTNGTVDTVEQVIESKY